MKVQHKNASSQLWIKRIGDKQQPVLDAEAMKADKQNFELRKAKAHSTICLNIDENLKNTMSSYIGKISQAAKDLENAGKVIPDDDIAYRMLANLPRSYDNIVMQLYQLYDKNVTSLNVRKFLLAEYDRVKVREKSYTRPKGPAVFSIERDVSEKKISANDFKERRKCFSCRTVGHIKKKCWKLKNDNKMPTHQQRKPPTFKKGEHSNPAALYASVYWTQSMDIEFVIDSVATEHFVNDINLFINFQKLSSSANVEDISDNEAHLVDIKIPNNFKESQNVPERENWCSATKDELEILKARDVHEIVPRPKNKNVLENKWVYIHKKDVTEKIKRYRARLAAQAD
ncbi:hypothetical protein AVEN_2662-1 [Araneus ventricosus]|uniref:CCHC-type domain-containing protein n=1 Tax=Araneus ventricosus TaxID=182803 RepID=A0A4Y2RI84_ARAVE|nr:hypothetical protein AVEN_2662-1 [Araneus ventricosus]